ncbi:hypothetical protein LX36DRAFT_712073 [Colletotrichum falcatum]|nr:hypothetical protein LX36DRAFT_712073 [Colletotrichum falcatum]
MSAKMEAIPDPQHLPPDPRLPGQQPRYSRDGIAESLANFYQSLPHLDPSRVRRAPPGGWPEITAEWFAAPGRKPLLERAVDLIRHLPYIDGDPVWVTPETFPVNYRTAVELSDGTGLPKPKWLVSLGVDLEGLAEGIPPWVVQLTMSVHRDGDIWLLDTMDGTVTKYIITGAVYPEPVGYYDEGDPRMWREEFCDDVTFPLESWLERTLQEYRDLSWFGLPRHKDPGVLWRGSQSWSEEIRELEEIMLQNGWPADYNGEECRRKLTEWMSRTDI